MTQKTKITFMLSLLIVGIFLPQFAWAVTEGDNALFSEQITKLENLFTGGYMRLGLLAVCGFTAIMGAVKQNGFMFITGILSGVFAYFMKNWITTTFTLCA